MIFSTTTRSFDLFRDDEHGYCVREVDDSEQGRMFQATGRASYLSCAHALQRCEGLVDVVPAVVLMEMRREISRRDHLSWLKEKV